MCCWRSCVPWKYIILCVQHPRTAKKQPLCLMMAISSKLPVMQTSLSIKTSVSPCMIYGIDHFQNRFFIMKFNPLRYVSPLFHCVNSGLRDFLRKWLPIILQWNKLYSNCFWRAFSPWSFQSGRETDRTIFNNSVRIQNDGAMHLYFFSSVI